MLVLDEADEMLNKGNVTLLTPPPPFLSLSLSKFFKIEFELYCQFIPFK